MLKRNIYLNLDLNLGNTFIKNDLFWYKITLLVREGIIILSTFNTPTLFVYFTTIPFELPIVHCTSTSPSPPSHSIPPSHNHFHPIPPLFTTSTHSTHSTHSTYSTHSNQSTHSTRSTSSTLFQHSLSHLCSTYLLPFPHLSHNPQAHPQHLSSNPLTPNFTIPLPPLSMGEVEIRSQTVHTPVTKRSQNISCIRNQYTLYWVYNLYFIHNNKLIAISNILIDIVILLTCFYNYPKKSRN